ncbi:MAG: glycosyltransferase [Proteobacteria bacterium]|nr:glycosyltransferase [Pseudomonadota bacterium]
MQRENFKKIPEKVTLADVAHLKIALLLPCLNEELTLAKVIRDFRSEIPHLDIYVFDNGSTDRSRAIAYAEGAEVVVVPRRGKGNVVRRMFEAVEADIYIMVDSDATYDPKGVWKLLAPVVYGEAEMAVGSRVADSSGAYRKFHQFGNQLIIRMINTIFNSSFTDICSGYRVMSHYFVKNIPLLRKGFEVETELTVYSLMNEFQVVEIPLRYGERPENSHSKLKTFSDGYKVLLTIVWLMRDLRPLLFFSLVSLVLAISGAVAMESIFPNNIFCQMLVAVAAVGLLTTGLILNTLNVKFSELQVLYRRQYRSREPLFKHQTLVNSEEPECKPRLPALQTM